MLFSNDITEVQYLKLRMLGVISASPDSEEMFIKDRVIHLSRYSRAALTDNECKMYPNVESFYELSIRGKSDEIIVNTKEAIDAFIEAIKENQND